MLHIVKKNDQYIEDGVESFTFKNNVYILRNLPKDLNNLEYCDLRLLSRALGFNYKMKKEHLQILINLSIEFA